MSNAEHLIENAICDFERNGSFDWFLSAPHNKMMAEDVGISLQDVTQMATHILFTLKPIWIEEEQDKMIARYGYEPPEELL